jgi:hypothetical protein
VTVISVTVHLISTSRAAVVAGRLIVPDGQIGDLPVESLSQKYSGSLLTQITFISFASWPDTKGAFRDRHERRAGMRWTRGALLTRALFLRTAKSCGPDASMVGVKSVIMLRITPAMVTTKPDHQGEHEVNRNTIACGNAGCPGATVVTNARAY